MWCKCWIAIVAVLMLGVCLSAQAEEASVLLEKGLYMEETVGDLDKAIEAYQQITTEADASRRYVAEAYYRLGMCYLKKQDGDKAARAFGKVTAAYSDQTELANAARTELAKLQPPDEGQPERGERPPRYVPLNTLVERALGDQESLDLEANEAVAYTMEGGGMQSDDAFKSAAADGCDLWAETSRQPMIAFIGMAVVPLEKESFDTIELQALALQIGLQEGVLPVTYKAAASALLRDREQLQAIEADLSRKLRETEGLVETLKVTRDKMQRLKRLVETNAATDAELADAKLEVMTAESNVVAAENHLTRLTEKRGSLEKTVPDAENLIAAAVLAGQVRRKAESGKPAVQFRLISQTLPLTYGFSTREGSIGTLQVLRIEDNKVYIRYKPLSYGQARPPVTRRVFLPDVDERPVMLDLATGSLVPLPDYDEYQAKFEFLGYGDLICNDLKGQPALALMRDATADRELPVHPEASIPYAALSPPWPYRIVITTREGRRFAVSVLKADKEGCELEYGPLGAAEADRKASELLSAEGWQLWRQRKLAEAQERFEKAVEKDPDNANAWNGLGWCQFNQGMPLNAKTSFQQCLTLEPKHAAALNGLGWIAKGQGETERAIEYWKKAVDAAPSATAALNGLTTTYMELKQYDEAAKYYEMWLKVEPKNPDVKAGLERAELHGGPTSDEGDLPRLITELSAPRPGAPRFEALNKIIQIGNAAVPTLIEEMKTNNNWQIPKALGAIGDKRATLPLIEKLEKCNWSPMREVVSEALTKITGKDLEQEAKAWRNWWDTEGSQLSATPTRTEAEERE